MSKYLICKSQTGDAIDKSRCLKWCDGLKGTPCCQTNTARYPVLGKDWVHVSLYPTVPPLSTFNQSDVSLVLNPSIGEGLPLMNNSLYLSGSRCHFYFPLSSSILRTEQWKNKYDSSEPRQGPPVSVSDLLPSLRLTLINWTGSRSLCQSLVLRNLLQFGWWQQKLRHLGGQSVVYPPTSRSTKQRGPLGSRSPESPALLPVWKTHVGTWIFPCTQTQAGT